MSDSTHKETGKNILIVDDEEVVRNVCVRSLSKRGYHLTTAENGMRALELMRQNTYEIVFTDYKMPVMDGLELLAAIKRDYPYAEVVIMTAYATLESAIEAMKNGAYDFILKPIKPEQIRMVAQKCSEKIRLGEENKALRIANQKLVELQKMKDKFIAITSHELRTPVSHLKGYVGILNDDYATHLSEEERKQCMDVILNAIDDLEEIVTSMHNLTHLENGRVELKPELVEINALVDEVVSDYQFVLKKRKQDIEVDKGTSAMQILADRNQIRGVLGELLQNAVKFTPDGGKVRIKTEVDGDFCVIRVADNGIGIDEAEQGKIFEKFYEVQDSNYHSTSKDGFMGGGLGIGLPSVRAIAEAHGGAVKVRSKKESGSEFLVYLPLKKDVP